MSNLSKTRSALFIAFLVIVWGINWPLTKIALSYTPPLLFSGIRTFLGGLLLLFVVFPKWRELRFKETWHIYIVSSVLNTILYYGIQTIGLNFLPAGLFSVIVFLQPVLLGLISWRWFGEEMYAMKMVGLILGFVGVAVISAGSLSGHLSLVGIIMAIASALCWAVGTAYVKKVGHQVNSVWLTTLQLLIGGLLLSVGGSTVESWSSIQWSVELIITTLFISMFVIAAGWIVYYRLMETGEASKIASYTFLIPVISLVSSMIFLHEAFTSYLLIGLLFILVSIYLVNRKRASATVNKTNIA